MNVWTCTRQGELYHHGIKGMKWGIRRFQNKDGSLTPAGRKRYDDGSTTKKNTKQHKIPENKSLHRLKLEDKYRKEGLTQEQAEQKAAKRIKAEKFVVAAATVTVASCVTYNKYFKDKTLKSNTEFQRIMQLPADRVIKNDESHKQQWLAYDKRDKINYKGTWGSKLLKSVDASYETKQKIAKSKGESIDGIVKDKVYDVTAKNKDKVKIASEHRARSTFAKLFKEDEKFRESLVDRARELEGRNNVDKVDALGKKVAMNKMTDIELYTKGYDYFNILLDDGDRKSKRNADKFYNALREQGVNAVSDINDKKYSGINSKKPIIVFDGDYEFSKRAMDDAEIQKNMKKTINMFATEELMKIGTPVVAALGAVPIVSKARVDKQVLQYKQSHPNTKMSDAEIEAMIKEQLAKK